MLTRVKVADAAAAVAGLALLAGSLLDQFGVSYNAYHELVLNVLVVTYLLGLATAAVSIAVSLGVLSDRRPWRTWAAAVAAVVLVNAVCSAVALGQIIKYLSVLANRHDVGLGAGVYLGIAGAAVLFGAVSLRPVIPFLERPVFAPSAAGATAGHPAPGLGWRGAPDPPDLAATPPPAEGPVSPAAPSPVATGSYRVPAPVSPRFAPFWAAVPTSRPIYRVEDPAIVVAVLHPGSWYAAVAPHAYGFILQLPTGETGVLVEVADLYRG